MTETDEPSPTLYGGKFSDVLDHPGHRAGVNHGTMTVTEIRDVAPSVVRISATMEHEGERERWLITNPAIRLELPNLEGDALVSRVYTVREARVNADEFSIDVDIVRHPGESPVMRWLAAAKVGTEVRILGPRPHFTPAFPPASTVGLFADETAIPALATILRDWPQGVPARAWVETPDRDVARELIVPDGVEVNWIERDIASAPGTTGGLPAAARLFSDGEAGALSIWAAGEHSEMRTIRNHFRFERGLDRDVVQVFGYWRRSVTSSQVDEQRLQKYREALARNPEFQVLDDFDDEN